MTDERHTDLAERERRIREAIRSTGDVRAATAFRERLKREFIDGTISEPAVPQEEPRSRGLLRRWWILVPAAAVVLLFALFLPRPSPTWSVLAARGDGHVEIDGQTLAADEPGLVARALGSGGRIRLSEEVALDLRLDDDLVLALDDGSDVTIPGTAEGGKRGPLIAEVHDGELRIKTGPGFRGKALHVLTAEGRTELVGTVVSVYKGDGYTCVCVLEGTARVGEDEPRLEEIPAGMLKVMFEDGSTPFVGEIAAKHGADLVEFEDRYRDVFSRRN